MRIERAILSVSDKRGIVELARALRSHNVEILSTGGTASHLAENNIEVTAISQWSGAPEILGGRVKTLTPKVFGAILHDRDNAAHRLDVERLAIPAIDLVVVNLYPFASTIAREGVTVSEAIEQIDIGGPSMLRAAAKNHNHVLPLCDPSLYEEFIRALEKGEIDDEFRLRCAIEVFRTTAAYDAMIATYLSTARQDSPAASVIPNGSAAAGDQSHELPRELTIHLDRFQSLRYGENPQQPAAFYVPHGSRPFVQVQGKELSYNNLLDLDSAMRLANAFAEPAAAVIKHTNPCGTSRRATISDAIKAAIETDPVSAFGGIIGTNREFDADSARLVEPMFLEVIVAPAFTSEARQILEKKKNLRLIAAEPWTTSTEYRSAAGGILAQSADRIGSRQGWRVVTERQPTPEELDGLEFAWIVGAHVKSNAIVLTNRSQTVGVGAGQMSRVDAARVAIMKSILPLAGTVAASDAFFPFRDGLDLLADAGVGAIIQPGGSVRDGEVIAAADERGIAMILTGERHFRH